MTTETGSQPKALAPIPTMGIIVPIMGIAPGTELTGAGGLFTLVQARILGLLYTDPDRAIGSAELIRLVSSGTGATHRQLKQMVRTGLLVEERQGNQRLYQANRASPIFEEVRSIILKTVGLADPLRTALASFGGAIELAFVFGSVASGTARSGSDVDLMIVSDTIDYARAFEALQPVEKILGRPVNPTVMTSEEWRRKRGDPESFASRIVEGVMIPVLGGDGELA